MRGYGHYLTAPPWYLFFFNFLLTPLSPLWRIPDHPTVARVPTAWTTAAARWTIATTKWPGVVLLSFPIEGIPNFCNIYANPYDGSTAQ